MATDDAQFAREMRDKYRDALRNSTPGMTSITIAGETTSYNYAEVERHLRQWERRLAQLTGAQSPIESLDLS